MKAKDVVIGEVYEVKVSGKLTNVKVTKACNNGGWVGINLATNREIRFRTGARLRPTPKKK
ncbi:MAG: hypothetical protein WAQ98_18970 [Blastocatellia bacterium]|jgi:hypothetical protein